ncbi:hypothetical protein L2755_12255 [Shewanella abyssi]|uniref:hypothetical protein n=1 Tax=Shewanella abyssi TaxID=311789 RepID=UPI002010599A|nr:hypothetical protein [Shewanella abyssi]MCL1050396.1 hypothetical protein [Shewanella abyssi]
MSFNYIYQGETHTDTTAEFMVALGMNEDQILSVLQQQKFESSQVTVKRLAAYISESDPMYAEWQYELASGNPSEDEFKAKWLAKVNEIKLRHPITAA